MIAELQVFWKFLQREFHLENAAANIAILDQNAVRELQEEMDNPDNFGMAKSFMTLGQQMGFDMTSEEGINQWMETFNAGIAPSLALSPPPPSITQSPEEIEIVRPIRFTLKRVTGKGHKKNRKRTQLEDLLLLAPGIVQQIKQAMNHSSLIELTDAANEELLAYFTEDVVHTRRELALARCALALAQLSEDKQ